MNAFLTSQHEDSSSEFNEACTVCPIFQPLDLKIFISQA